VRIRVFFWKDPWMDGRSLGICFNRLFSLADDLDVSVAEMCRRGWVEEQVCGCCSLVDNVTL
jgi:hypothetical protein